MQLKMKIIVVQNEKKNILNKHHVFSIKYFLNFLCYLSLMLRVRLKFVTISASILAILCCIWLRRFSKICCFFNQCPFHCCCSFHFRSFSSYVCIPRIISILWNRFRLRLFILFIGHRMRYLSNRILQYFSFKNIISFRSNTATRKQQQRQQKTSSTSITVSLNEAFELNEIASQSQRNEIQQGLYRQDFYTFITSFIIFYILSFFR